MVWLTGVAFALTQAGEPRAYAVPRLSGVTKPGLPAVTGRIVVDQFGYAPNSEKVAIVSDPVKGFDAADHYQPGPNLQVRSVAGGKVVFSAAPTPWRRGATDEPSGDRGWWFDFSRLATPGAYYVFDPKSGLRSTTFRIDERVFDGPLRAATRMFYFQRLATPIEAKYTRGPWTDGPGLLQDAHARSVEHKTDASRERDLSGGWMDAGDTDKYPPFNGDVIHPLLYAYRANPAAFSDDFGIPESGNRLPDLLDEIKWQLDWLVKMQFADGSVPVKMGNIDYSGVRPLSKDRRTRYYGPKDSGATIYTAAIFAHAARVYRRFPESKPFAADLERRALVGWKWFHENPRTFKADTGEIKSGIANRSADEQDRMEVFAAIHLFALTGDKRFDEIVRAKAAKTRQLSEPTWSPYETGVGESLVDYAELPNADPTLAKRIKSQLAKSARDPNWAPDAGADLFRAWMQPTNYHWGSNFVRGAWGVASLLAADHAGLSKAESARLRSRAADMLHSFHGVNPISCVYLTNMKSYGAENSLMSIYHDRYGAGTPFEHNPPPGYVVGGPNSSFGGKAGDGRPSIAWIREQPRGKAYADFALGWPEASWELSEPAIYYQAMYVRLVAAFAALGPKSGRGNPKRHT